MDSHLKLLPAFLKDMRAFNDSIGTAINRQWNRPGQSSASAQSGVDDLFGGLINYLMIIGF